MKKLNILLLLFIAILLINSGLVLATYAHINVAQPENNSESLTVDQPFIDWVEPNVRVTRYDVAIAMSPDFETLIYSEEMVESYHQVQTILSPGRYYLYVTGLNETEAVARSSLIEFVILTRTPFNVDVNTESYDVSNIVRFNLQGQAHGFGGVTITNDDFFFYHPILNLQTYYFLAEIPPGTYNIIGNLTYGTYTSYVSSSFTVYNGMNDLNTEEGTFETEEETTYYDLTYKVVDENLTELNDVRIKIYDSDDELQGNEKTNATGIATFSLVEGDYDATFTKNGFDTKRINQDLDEDINRTIILMVSEDDIDDTSDNNNNNNNNNDNDNSNNENERKEIAMGLNLIEPNNGDVVNSDIINFKFKLDSGVAERCQVLSNDGKAKGWQLLKTLISPSTENIISIDGLKPGELTFAIRCLDKNRNYQFSKEVNLVIVDVGSINDKLDSFIEEITKTLRKIRTIGELEQQVLKALNVQSDLESARTKLSDYRGDATELINDGASQDDIDKLNDKIKQDILNFKKTLVNEFDLIKVSDSISFSGEDDVEDMKETTLTMGESIEELDKYSTTNLNDLQENFIIRSNLYKIKTSTFTNITSEKSVVVKKITALEDYDSLEDDGLYPFSFLEYVPMSILSSNKGFVTNSNITFKPLMKFSDITEDYNTIMYYFDNEISDEEFNSLKTLAVPKSKYDFDTKKNDISSITGMSILDSTTGFPLIGILIAILISSLLVSIILIVPNARYGKIKKDFHFYLDSFEKEDFRNALLIQERINNRYSKLGFAHREKLLDFKMSVDKNANLVKYLAQRSSLISLQYQLQKTPTMPLANSLNNMSNSLQIAFDSLTTHEKTIYLQDFTNILFSSEDLIIKVQEEITRRVNLQNARK